MADRQPTRGGQDEHEPDQRSQEDPWQRNRPGADSFAEQGQHSSGRLNHRPGDGHGDPEHGGERGSQGTPSGAQSGTYTAAGSFGSEHRGYAHAHGPAGGSYGSGQSTQGGSFGGGYGAQSTGYGSSGGSNAGAPTGYESQFGGHGTHAGYAPQGQGAFSQGGGHNAQGSTGYGTHGYGGQTSGYSLQSGNESYGGDGGSGGRSPQTPRSGGQGSQGGYGAQGGYGRQDQPAEPGGYGSQGGGYGSQSSYASHGGYGSQGRGGYGSHGGDTSGSHGDGSAGAWAARGAGQQAGVKPRGPKGYQRSDERIREDICEQLMRTAHVDPSDVSIEVSGGKVTLDGTVPDRRMKHAIEDLAHETAGVNDVENRVRVGLAGPSTSSTAKSSDE